MPPGTLAPHLTPGARRTAVPWNAQFLQVVAKRGDVEAIQSISMPLLDFWMQVTAHAHVQLLTRNHTRARARLGALILCSAARSHLFCPSPFPLPADASRGWPRLPLRLVSLRGHMVRLCVAEECTNVLCPAPTLPEIRVGRRSNTTLQISAGSAFVSSSVANVNISLSNL
jgi:hypothetical protein